MRALVVVAPVAAAVVGSIITPPSLRLVWNTTASTPIGLYMVTQATPKRGDLVVTRLSPAMEALALSFGILSPNVPVLKPVAAVAGDRVCRSGSVVTINGHRAAIARDFDPRGRPLPIWQGCRRLSHSQVFVLARHPDSFDSRYYGPIDIRLARGIAHPLVTFRRRRHTRLDNTVTPAPRDGRTLHGIEPIRSVQRCIRCGSPNG